MLVGRLGSVLNVAFRRILGNNGLPQRNSIYQQSTGNGARYLFALLALWGFFQSAVIAAPITAAGNNWAMTLDEAAKTGPRGSLLTYIGNIANLTGADLLINVANLDFNATTPATNYSFDLAAEFLDTLGIIPASGYSGPLFFVRWASSAPVGTTGSGVFELTIDVPGDPAVLSVAFSGNVSKGADVPSPGVLGLLIAGLLGWIASSHRRVRSLPHAI